ncbi:hypothetical protein ACFPN1_10170 [Lysobacter yangpyeongensis]|uniref:Uncharacterized protein n=1 Tax=Lysobacter yangpyeongensis TaxID=346182 RepID=A0ABW0SMS4_9GAMM
MSIAVQFLEALARNPKPLSDDEFAAAIAKTEMDPSAQKALLDRNAQALSKALGGRLKMMCMVVPAENDEPQQDEEPADGEDVPDRESSSVSA